jgi:hypothetical protein
MSALAKQTQDVLTQPVASTTDGETLIKHLLEVMDALVGTVEQETALVRAGKLVEAAKLEPVKTDLSNMYVADTARIKASQIYLNRVRPAMTKELRQRHDLFRAVLQMNLTVLATAHAVSEGIMRGVSAELARKATPQAYGASGHATTPSAGARQPLTLSRVL